MVEVNADWNRILDRSWSIPLPGSREVSVRQKGRCRKCWGSLVGRTGDNHEYTGIKCLVCGNTLEGMEARNEAHRMDKESLSNAIGLTSPSPSNVQYEEAAVFLWKVFPDLHRQSEQELQSHIRHHSQPKRGWLTRHSFPEGAPSYFYLQAWELMAAVECLPRYISVTHFPKTDINEDDSLSVHMHEHLPSFTDYPQFSEHDMIRRLGSTMGSGVLSAFACELVIKAICLTVHGEAQRTHDLSVLYGNLPNSSHRRLVADLHNIEAEIHDCRHLFGDWRYFEHHIGEDAMRALIDTQRVQRLAQVTRVLLDEGNIMGLGCDVRTTTTKYTRIDRGERQHKYETNIRLRPREGPPK